MRRPTWLDTVVQDAMSKGGEPTDIANAIANSPKFIEAIRSALSIKIAPGIVGLSKAQMISDAILESLKPPQ